MAADRGFEELREVAARMIAGDVIKMLPNFTVPLQERTRNKTAAIVAAAAYMLQSRAFSDISVDEIASVANCSVPTIYARFKNKEALLPVISLVTMEFARARMEKEIDLEIFVGKGLEDLCFVFTEFLMDYFTDNNNTIHAALIKESATAHQTYNMVSRWISSRVNKVACVLMNREASVTRPSVDFGIGLLVSLLRESTIVTPLEGTRDRATLAKLLTFVIEAGLRP